MWRGPVARLKQAAFAFFPPALLRNALMRLALDRSGAAAIYVAAMLPVLMGGALLAIDASRLYSLHAHLQKAADAYALAGAAELDRRPASIARATKAINTMVVNDQRFASSGGATVAVAEIRFLQSLPASDASAIGSTHVTTDPALARFVEVTVAPAALNTIFPASFLGGANTVTTQARAVAGFDSAVCQFTPFFICRPACAARGHSELQGPRRPVSHLRRP